MQIVVTLDDTSPPLIGFQLPKNKIITDSQGRQWTVGENVLLEIERSPITVNYDLTFGGFAYNAYERIHAPSSNCMAMANQKCCPVTSGNNNMYFLREMKQNVTKYNYYYASMNSPQYSIQIRAVQTSKTETLTLANTVKKQTGAGLTAWIVADLIDVTRYMFFSNDFVVIPDNYTPTQEGFLCGRYNFGDSINRIGISPSTYIRNVKCSDKIGLLTSVSGSSPMDQFEKFRKDTISTAIGCTFSPSSSTTSSNTAFPSSTLRRSYPYTCQKIVTSQIVLRIPTDGSGVKIIRLFGNPVITKSGVNEIKHGDRNLEMFLDVFNNADSSGNFDVIPNACCVSSVTSTPNLPKWDCHSVMFSHGISQTVESYKVYRFIFSMLLDQVVNKFGYCTFSVMQYGKVDLIHSMNFTTLNISSNSIETDIPAVHDDCVPPYGKKIFGVGNKVLCITECPSQDLVYDSVKLMCKPVNCKLKYNATRNYFNPETQLCEVVKTCLEWKENYNAITNTCELKDSFKNQTQANDQQLDLMNEVSILSTLPCGNKGDSSQDKTRCMCKSESQITAFDYKPWNPIFSPSLQQESQFCMIDTLSLSSPPSSEILSSGILDMVISLDVWLQLVIGISSCLLMSLLYLFVSVCCPCCCIRRMNMRLEVQKREFGEYKRKTFCELISSILCYGDFSLRTYHLSKERTKEMMKQQFELNLWRKKRLKHAKLLLDRGEKIDSNIALQIQMDMELDQLEDLLKDKKQDMLMEAQFEKDEDSSNKEEEESDDSQQHEETDDSEEEEPTSSEHSEN
ncbi:hypothetical protein FDP41_011345 [Naegleria fowleri]|uniref:Uncharacterized protein n=1 Tax=Naegleria fowleri TaxID=5763 RepID=A0A6A5CAK8_NAEFO|nr:uncharacterized protein FDP41_011345 [Naegleria fowleri]KAF0982415.1 hypothetical protein FDP41_011345 [Naegleria fowleri]